MENKTDGTANHNRGADWEFESLVRLHKSGFKHVGTTRLWNKELDSKGVDFCSIYDDMVFPYNITCKATSGLINYPQLLDNLPRQEGIINTVFHRKFYKGEIIGEFAILDINDFITLMDNRDAR